MSRCEVNITAENLTRRLQVEQTHLDQPLTELLRRADTPLNTRCGGRSLCDGCMVELIEGQLQHIPTGRMISGNGRVLTVRGCEHRLRPAPLTRLSIPARSVLRYEPCVVSDFRINIPSSHNPLFPLDEAITSPQFAAAVDLGTTTVAVLLIDLADGRIVSRDAGFNQQTQCGDDVLTRINLCSTDGQMLRRLQAALAESTVAPLLAQALLEAGAEPRHLRGLCFAGNTTMLHLLLGIDPTSMGVAPFTPAFLEHRVIEAGEVFASPARAVLPLDPRTPCHLLPGAAAYVGADLTAGVLASGLLYEPGPCLLVDVGTNGEIILKHDGKLTGCATAAGPAFEGAGLSCGMRAGDGAISRVRMTGNPFELEIDWIGREKRARLVGVCGSAYMDFLSQARATGLLSETGRYELNNLPAGAHKRILPWQGNDVAFRLANAPGGVPIVITQRDVSRLLQAKAAIAAGIVALLHRHGLSQDQIRSVYLAGGFGTHIDSESGIRCGLLPDFSPWQIQAVGNTALAGAYLAVIDRALLDEAHRAARSIEVLELNEQPEFESLYIDHLLLPKAGK